MPTNTPGPDHVGEDLPDLLAAVADPAVARHVEACPTCAHDLAALEELYGELALLHPPEAPGPRVRARVLASCRSGRLARFAGQVSALFAVDEARAHVLLDGLDAAEGWEPALLPGSFHRLVEFEPPSRLKFFIRVPAGNEVPRHEHHGPEQTLVLQGRLVDDTGGTWLPGQQMPKDTGSRHSFRADGGVDLVCGVVVDEGVTLVE